jgi:hypothetical protein
MATRDDVLQAILDAANVAAANAQKDADRNAVSPARAWAEMTQILADSAVSMGQVIPND